MATRDNAIEDGGKKKKYDKKCYNCLKKSNFAKNCLKYSKKLVLVLAISMPVTDDDQGIIVKVFCMHYPVWFQESQE